MTNEEIIEKVIEKANINGWNRGFYCCNAFDMHESDTAYCNSFIYSHDFAKAFFGEEEIELYWHDDETHNVFGGTLVYSYEEGGNMFYRAKKYIYHLQQMVISEDSIKYLNEFI